MSDNIKSQSANSQPQESSVRVFANLPLVSGKTFDVPLVHATYKNLTQAAYRTQQGGKTEEHALIYKGDIKNLPADAVVLLRINSACFTGDIFHDASCDCNWQMEEAFRLIDQGDGPGILLYHFAHEGKGFGYFDKLVSFDGQMYPVPDDIRDFLHAVAILLDLGITRVRLMTNNPEKQKILTDHGIEIVEVVSVVSQDPAVRHLYDYKAKVWKHALPTLSDSLPIDEQSNNAVKPVVSDDQAGAA